MLRTTALTIFVFTGCATQGTVPDIDPADVLTRDAVKKIARPILPSRADTLTVGTQGQIEDHNNRIWCEFPELRPEGFNPDSTCLEADQ